MPRADAESTADVLAQMTAGIMGRKTAAAAKLTPVSGEVVATHKATTPLAAPAPASVAFPFDQPDVVQAAIADAERNAREVIRQMEFVLQGLDALKAGYAVEESKAPTPVSLDQERQKRERAADEAAREREAIQTTERDEQADFEAQVAAKAQAAQEATFKAEPSGAAVAIAEDMGADIVGWLCPVHDKFEVKTSKRGREYRVCPNCDEFERL